MAIVERSDPYDILKKIKPLPHGRHAICNYGLGIVVGCMVPCHVFHWEGTRRPAAKAATPSTFPTTCSKPGAFAKVFPLSQASLSGLFLTSVPQLQRLNYYYHHEAGLLWKWTPTCSVMFVSDVFVDFGPSRFMAFACSCETTLARSNINSSTSWYQWHFSDLWELDFMFIALSTL